jgi:hypothetical protein
MKIVIRNPGQEKVPTKEIRAACNFYSDKLLYKRQSKNVHLTISFGNIDCKGYIEWMDRPVKPRRFKIVLSNKYKTKQTLLTLAHEMVHLKQYVLGEMTDTTLRSNSKWKKRELHESKVDYFDFPYETEAYGREQGLYQRYLDHSAELPTGLYNPKRYYGL